MYQLGEVANAAGEKPETVKLWLSRGYLIMGKKDREAAGTGRVRLFSFETAMQIAVGAELMRQCYLPARRALDAAIDFAHTGDATDRFRQPGRPYGEGDTYLVVSGEADHVVCHQLPSDFLHYLPYPRRHAFVAVDAGAVYHRAAAKLGGDPLGDWRDQTDKLARSIRERDANRIAQNWAEHGE